MSWFGGCEPPNQANDGNAIRIQGIRTHRAFGPRSPIKNSVRGVSPSRVIMRGYNEVITPNSACVYVGRRDYLHCAHRCGPEVLVHVCACVCVNLLEMVDNFEQIKKYHTLPLTNQNRSKIITPKGVIIKEKVDNFAMKG